jgi:GNAT superfamily N-acetyltransferase
MHLRAFTPMDLPAVVGLFHDTIHQVNRADYSDAQVEAWAPAVPNLDRWQEKLASEHVVVAEIDGEIVGFSSWTEDGYLDFLYVHHAHQRKGIATALYGAAEKLLKAKGLARIHTQSSTTAQPFFLQQGFKVAKSQSVVIRGVPLPNAVMEKSLD